ncbi:lytic transglycosylase domain-containing protein [Candidatus Neoehrlichia procyonis]|uniref:Transglycosylase SLT domain protein n=1 Tax=Candidatus Neoehrlichia procyonis str. RAC413 TaxID=1359163 RepID=A0A0F3NRB6_9RICK|nr:lytic transglycosylase domain-containing protein [Candidatus Neoehrlichia lotoris]KJV69454.1 transglycosylase SLT domain protein [Candidatus Neoehrlichia lotoris str. RAC413]
MYKYINKIIFTFFQIAHTCLFFNCAHGNISVPWNISDIEIENFKSILNSAYNKDYSTAQKHAKKLSKDFLIFADWLQIYNNCPSNEIISNFTKLHPKWPPLIQHQVTVTHSLNTMKPHCSNIKRTVFLNYNILSSDSFATLVDKLLWNKKITAVITDILPQNILQLIYTRIAFQRNTNSSHQHIQYIKLHEKSNFGILYDYLVLHNKNHDINDTILYLISLIPYTHDYQQELWYIYKIYIYKILYNRLSQYYTFAYQLIKHYNQTSNSSILAESYWLSGWISFEFLKDYKAAYKHFSDLYNISKTHIEYSRSAYWAARSVESLKQTSLATKWFKKSSAYKTTFYGQLSLIKTGINYVDLSYNYTYSTNDFLNCKNNIFAKIAYLLSQTNTNNNISEIFTYHAIKNAKSMGEMGIITELHLLNNNFNVAIKSAKTIESQATVLRSLYPLYTFHKFIPSAIILSIIRQESLFKQDAVSRSSATGLMQIMPYTAIYIAKKLHIKYHKDYLKDPQYNIALGSSYLKTILQKYNNSLILSIAAYNAGPYNVDRWIKNLGNPSNFQSIEQVVTWIESIPFHETRNYVQRVLENLQVYSSLLNNKKSTIIIPY